MLFLVTGTVRISRYMIDRVLENKELRLVEAESEHEAERKFQEFFAAQSSDYDRSYSVYDADATAIIV